MVKGPLTDEYIIYGEGLCKPEEQEVSEAERLLKEFESHDWKEGDFIRSYKEIAAKSNLVGKIRFSLFQKSKRPFM